MSAQTPEFVGWALAVGLGTVLVLLVVAGWWLFRQHRRSESREAFAEELREVVGELGFDDVWHAALFRADVFGVRGRIDEFDVEIELWEGAGRELFRLSIYFPGPTHQTMRVLTRRRTVFDQVRGLEEVELGDEAFDEHFNVYCHLDDVERIPEVLVTGARRRLLSIGRRVDGVKVADRSLYVFAERKVSLSGLRKLIDEAIAAGSTIYERAQAVGPAEAARRTTQYQIAATDVLGRESGEFPIGELQSDERGGESDEESTAGQMPES